MAQSTIALANIVLKDNFPWAGDFKRQPPQDGFGAKNTKDNNQLIATLPLGTKCIAWDAVAQGWATFIYLRMSTVAGTTIGVLCATSTTPTTVAVDPVNEVGNTITGGMAAVALGTITANYCNWFWCGGPCPQSDYLVGGTALSLVTIATDTAIVAGGPFELSDDDAGTALLIQLLVTAGTACAGISKAADAA